MTAEIGWLLEKSARRLMLFVDDLLQIWRDGQALEHADIRTAGFTDWNNADSRSSDPQEETNSLTGYGRNSPATYLQPEHEPMRLCMCTHIGLTDDVGALQVPKGALQIPSGDELLATSDCSVECRSPPGVQPLVLALPAQQALSS